MKLTVEPPRTGDVGRGVATLPREALAELNIASGDYAILRGPEDGAAVTQVLPADDADGTVRVDEPLRRTAGVETGDAVDVEAVSVESGEQVTVAMPEELDVEGNPALYFRDKLIGQAVTEGQTVRIKVDEEGVDGTRTRYVPLLITATDPSEAVVVRDWTKIRVSTATAGEISIDDGAAGTLPSGVTYADVGGLDEELARVRELIELPLQNPALFDRLGVDPPTGVLVHGPPGTGKSRLARAIATETDAHFETISGPAIVSKYQGESEQRLREAFATAEDNEPAIVLVDDLDSIAGRREAGGDLEGRIVAQLLASLDGLAGGQTVVIGATNRPDAIDPALRRPERFDREIEIGVPDREGREEILRIHTRGMPLDDVDLGSVADRTHGYVGADLANLARESAMTALRRRRPDDEGEVDPGTLADLRITDADVEAALRETDPSALREVFVEVPDVSWADVGGLEATKERLREAIQWPLEYPDAYERVALTPAKGVLLYGPPGTGKTLLAKAVANEAQSNFISIKGPELLDKYVGESEKGVRDIFEKARSNAPAVIFFDEIDAIATERGRGAGDSGVAERVVSQLLTELDGLEELEDVVVIAATNRPDLLDDALLRPGRLDRHVAVDAPDEAARREIFAVHTRDKPLAGDVDLSALAAETEGYVGADIEAVCREAAQIAVREFVARGGDPARIVLTAEHFRRAVEETDPSGDGSRVAPT